MHKSALHFQISISLEKVKVKYFQINAYLVHILMLFIPPNETVALVTSNTIKTTSHSSSEPFASTMAEHKTRPVCTYIHTYAGVKTVQPQE